MLKCLGEKVIYDTHEDFSKKILLRGWIPKPIRVVVAKLVDVMERLASKISNGMIVTQKEQAQKFKGSFFIGNAPIVSPTSKYPLAKSNEKLELVYLGGISKDRGLAYMLDLLESLNKHRDTKLTLIGFPINDNFLEEAQKLPIWKQVNYLGAMKQEEAFELVAQADFGMVTILDVADYKHTSPNKIYEYMMLGTPFVATNFPAWMEQLDALNSGLFTSVDSVEAQLIEQLIAIKKDTELYQDMAKCGVQYTQNIFNWDITEAPKLAKCLKQL